MESENELEYEQPLDLGLLIELIQNYGHLHDLSNRDYKNVIKKEESWKEISEMIGVSEPDLKKIWKNLRDKYMPEK
ncbi:unnamed protein product [Ceutorhynchus assimilis]|uniref:MADF domain-containing protein n=1 Tax=Ceutorhynchus assimilis TaxID=467358 RepID=A0A9N9MM50_9CUCU|nr:unnamed protein product [Ceutorhynchus assimilis]